MARRPAPLNRMSYEGWAGIALCPQIGEYVFMNAKTTSERVEKLRQEREALSLRRRELYAHDDDWPKLQELAAKLQRKRERMSKRAKG